MVDVFLQQVVAATGGAKARRVLAEIAMALAELRSVAAAELPAGAILARLGELGLARAPQAWTTRATARHAAPLRGGHATLPWKNGRAAELYLR